jgi:O-antigen ligase
LSGSSDSAVKITIGEFERIQETDPADFSTANMADQPISDRWPTPPAKNSREFYPSNKPLMSKFKPESASPAFPERRPAPERQRPMRPPAATSATGLLAPERPQPAGTAQGFARPDIGGDEATSGPAVKLAFAFTLLFIFFRFSFLHELIASKLQIDLHILLIVGALSIFMTLLAGHLLAGVGNRITITWFAFACCMVLATMFSTWRGGSFAILYPYFRTTLILVPLIPAVAQSPKSIAGVLKMVGWAGLVTIVMGLTMNDFRTGRLELSAADSVANSNDYAAIVILVMPAIAFLTLRSGTRIAMKVVGCAALALGCFLVLSTGSRGALISLGLSILYLLKLGSGKVRVAILLGIPLLALIAIPFLPAEASARLGTLFSSGNAQEEADASKTQRTALLMESLKFTLQHPLLGVGPGTFQEYQAGQAAKNGERGMWHETHNTYTQISSECGIPAFLCYFAAIVMTLWICGRGRKSADRDIREVSSVLSMMMVSFGVCMFFLAQGYGFGFPVMGGIAVAIDRALKRERALAPIA